MATETTQPESRSSLDDIIDVYKKDVDRTLIQEALKLSVEERVERMIRFMEDLREIREAAQARKEDSR